MGTMLPWAALATAAAAFLMRDGTPSSKPSPGEPTALWRNVGVQRPAWIAVALCALVSLFAGWRLDASLPGAWHAGLGILIGAVLAAASHFAEAARPGQGSVRAAPLAFAVAAVSLSGFVAPENREPMVLGTVLGAGLNAWILGSGIWATLAAAMAAFVAAANALGAVGHGDRAGSTGDALGVAGAVAAVLAIGAAELVRRQQGHEKASAGGAVFGAALLFALGAVFLANRYLFLGDVGTLAAGAAGAGLVVHWLTAGESDDSGLRFIVSAFVWVGLATVAFGLMRGYGMAIAVLSAGAVLAVAGNARGLLGLGPALGLVLYRLFRESHEGVARAFDIGQHYAILGLLLGILLPLLFVAWSQGRPATSTRMAAASWIAATAFAGITLASAVFLGAKGVVGLIVGLGIAPIVEGLRGSNRLQALTLGAGASATMVLGFEWLGASLDLTRDEKLPLLGWIIAATLAAAAVVAALAPARTEDPQ